MTKTLSLKPANAATVRLRLEAHQRKIGLPQPSPEHPARLDGDAAVASRAPKQAQSVERPGSSSHKPEGSQRPPRDDRRKGPPARPDEWSLTLDIPKANRMEMAAELENAIAAAEAVPPTPKRTRDLRIAAAIAHAAPSWPIGWLLSELRKQEKHALAKALHSSAFGLRIARFTDMFEKSAVFYGDDDS